MFIFHMIKMSADFLTTMRFFGWLVILLSVQLQSISTADSVLRFSVKEEAKPGTFVADISKTEITTKIKAFDGELRFQFQSITEQVSFSINSSTGVIRTKGELDRETLSLYRDTFQIQVKVSKGVVTALIPTEIKVTDINDNSPSFKELVEHISVSESAPLDAELSLTAAVDVDIGNNSVQSYDIVDRNDDGHFELKVVRPTSDITKVKLVVAKRLDRELNDSYYLVLEARDGGNPPRVGRKGINVTILDSNDHIPKFSRDLYVGEVKENSLAGTFVLNVTARDEDIGTNGQVVYSLEPRPELKDLFSLDSRTGQLRTNAVLDYEKAKSYQLEVTARDRGPDSIPSTAVITVKVLDENDNTPEISLNFLPDVKDKNGKIPEDIPVETGLALVTVRDKDSGDNGGVTVTLFHHKNDFELREVFAGQYILEVRRSLSLDRHERYKIGIVAKDHGAPFTRQASELVTIHLADSNRHAPEFEKKLYHVNIRDDVTPGAIVTIITATDKDHGMNAELYYSLERLHVGASGVKNEDLAKWFTVDGELGHIRVINTVWCAFTPSFLLTINSRDNGRVPLYGNTELNITVQCSQHVYNFSITENKAEGSEVGRISLTSLPPLKPLRLKLIDTEDSTDFDVDKKLGIISTTKKLDRESTEFYTLEAVISDRNTNIRVTVNIVVLDVNDNAPVFVGLQDNHKVALSTVVSPGDALFTVQAIDKDVGSNGAVKYSIVDGNDAEIFNIDWRSGEITVLQELTGTSYAMVIRASDSGLIENEAFVRLIFTVMYKPAVTSVSRAPDVITSETTTNSNVAVVGNRKEDPGFFANKNMVIVVAVCAGFVLLFICALAIFCVKCRQRKNGDKRGSYHEPEISREDALKASKKMYNQATINNQPTGELFNFARNKPINVSPLPIKKMHPTMAGQGAMNVSPTGRPLPADVYYPNGQTVVECHSSEDELDSGRGGSSRGSSPYCPHSPNSKKKEDCCAPQDVRYAALQRFRSPMMPPPPPPYDDAQRRRAFVTISGVTHSTTDL